MFKDNQIVYFSFPLTDEECNSFQFEIKATYITKSIEYWTGHYYIFEISSSNYETLNGSNLSLHIKPYTRSDLRIELSNWTGLTRKQIKPYQLCIHYESIDLFLQPELICIVNSICDELNS